jgi:hypothetical protein
MIVGVQRGRPIKQSRKPVTAANDGDPDAKPPNIGTTRRVVMVDLRGHHKRVDGLRAVSCRGGQAAVHEPPLDIEPSGGALEWFAVVGLGIEDDGLDHGDGFDWVSGLGYIGNQGP